MMLRELLLVSYCAVLWVLFRVPFQSFVLCHSDLTEFYKQRRNVPK